ncbi:MAG: hypothetical protein ACFFEJ_17995 [Candidatus Thorarchaeota archaeon]
MSKIAKADLLGNVLWSKTYEYLTYGSFELVAGTSQMIVTLGTGYLISDYFLILNGWDSNGGWLWRALLECDGAGSYVRSQALEIGPEGNIYITGIQGESTVVYKVSSSGESLWNCTLSDMTGSANELITKNDGSMTALFGFYSCEISALGVLGTVVESVPSIQFSGLFSNSDIIGYYKYEPAKNITRFDSDGEVVWTSRIMGSDFGDSMSDIVNIISVNIGASGNVSVLATCHVMNGGSPVETRYALFQYDLIGNRVASWTVLGDKYESGLEYHSIPMTYGNGGLLYISAEWRQEDFGIDILVYNPDSVAIPDIPLQLDLIPIVIIAAIILVIIVVVVAKKRA